jgi:adenylate kinase family enzyme
MSKQYESEEYVTDEDLAEEEINDDVTNDNDNNAEEDDESCLESIVKEVLDENQKALSTYVSKPDSPNELTGNESVKKFIALKVREKVMESFQCRLEWDEDEQLKNLFRDCKKAMKNSPDLEAEAAMKTVLRQNNSIEDVVERILEETMDDDDDEDDDGDVEE